MLPVQDLDVMIVGAGFGGLHTLYHLRKAGFTTKCFEKGSNLGGTWFWNRYPGARVDSDVPIYQFSDKSVWEDWEWKERFPGYDELRQYFAHLDKKWQLTKDVIFNTEITSAHFDESSDKWIVGCNDGTTVRCRWLIACLGFAAKRYVPQFKGLDSFKGQWSHTGVWPQSGLDIKNKRVAVIGTGASGVQTIQEIAPDVAHLTVYQRTPNLALPMVQKTYRDGEEKEMKVSGAYDDAFQRVRHTFAGFHFGFSDKDTKDDSPEERRAFYEDLWTNGGFRFWLAGYKDLFTDQDANDKAYAFWAEKTRARLVDPKKRDLLAPLKPPHPFGTKRPSLEQHYYEVFNQSNVDIVDVSQHPIEEITPTGIRTAEGHIEFDVIVIATGFDSVTGSLTQIDIKGTDGVNIKERWHDRAETYLGMTMNRYPNMFFMYGVQGPTAFANGPTCVEVQGEWIEQALQDMRASNVTRFEPTLEAQKEWTQKIEDIWANSLFPQAKSWYQGSNIPGKPIQPLNWAGGMPAYITEITQCRNDDYRGFQQSK